MRKPSPISMILGCTLLLPAMARASQPESQAAASSPAAAKSESNRSIHKTQQVAIDKKKLQPYTKGVKPQGERVTPGQEQHGGAAPSQSKQSPQTANGQPPASQRYTPNVGQPTQHSAVPAAKAASLPSVQASNALPVRPSTMLSPAATAHNDVRHRGSNPSAIGGATTSKASNTAVISGSTVHRRP